MPCTKSPILPVDLKAAAVRHRRRPKPDTVILRFPLPAAQHAALKKLADCIGLSKEETAIRLLEPKSFESFREILDTCAVVLANRREQLGKDEAADELARQAAAQTGRGT